MTGVKTSYWYGARCRNCDAMLDGRPDFCPECEEPLDWSDMWDEDEGYDVFSKPQKDVHLPLWRGEDD